MQSSAFPEAHGEGQCFVLFCVGVVWCAFVDDICYEAECERTVHAIPFAVAESCEPDDGICYFLHILGTKITIFPVTSK